MSSTQRAPRKDWQRNREALLSAAFEVFGERGIGAPLDVIAKRAGVSNATLYRQFPKRQDLLAEVLLANLERNASVLADAVNQSSPWEGLVDYLTWLFAEQIDNPAYMSALRAIPAGENEAVDRLRDAALNDFARLLESAKHKGAVRPDRWIEDVFLALALNETLAHTGHTDPASASRRFLDLTLDTLAVRPTRTATADAEPDTVLALRRTLGHELAGLSMPAQS